MDYNDTCYNNDIVIATKTFDLVWKLIYIVNKKLHLCNDIVSLDTASYFNM